MVYVTVVLYLAALNGTGMKPTIPILLFLGAWITACNPVSDGIYHRVQGFAQGTTYHIIYQLPTEQDLQEQVTTVAESSGTLSDGLAKMAAKRRAGYQSLGYTEIAVQDVHPSGHQPVRPRPSRACPTIPEMNASPPVAP